MSDLSVTIADDCAPAEPAMRGALKALAQRSARLVTDGSGARIEAGRTGGSVAVGFIEHAVVGRMQAAGWLTAGGDGQFVLSAAGRAIVRAMKAAPSPAVAGAGGTGVLPPLPARGDDPQARHERECVLAWLKARRNKDGMPFLSDEAFDAGERLRADFHGAGMMPRLTIDWSAQPRSADERRGLAGVDRDQGATAAAAAERVRRALAAVPPEFAGLLIDVCGYDRRLQEVEKNRRLPQRTGAYLLGIALAILARHYGLAPARPDGWQPRPLMRRWGSADYRPTIDGGTMSPEPAGAAATDQGVADARARDA